MSFHKRIGEFCSTDAKHSIRYYIYEPEELSEIRAVLQISHGMCEYIERYEDFASFLCDHGFLVCGNDHLGHGELAQKSNTLGYFAQEDGFQLLIEDLHKLTALIKEQYPSVPYFLLGHSMGSFVARAYLSKYAGLLSGAVIMGSSGGNPLADAGVFFAERSLKRHGPMSRSSFLKKISLGSYNRKFRQEGSPNGWLTRDTTIRSAYDNDPLCNFTFTSEGFRDLFSLLKYVSRKEWPYTLPKNLPLLIISGADDPVGNYGKGIDKLCQRLKKAGIQDITKKLYSGARHEILNETNREEVYQEIESWLTLHCTASK